MLYLRKTHTSKGERKNEGCMRRKGKSRNRGRRTYKKGARRFYFYFP